MGRVSGMEIFSSQGLKKPPKITPWEASFSLPQARANFKDFFNSREEEISVPKTHGPFGNCIQLTIVICHYLGHSSRYLHSTVFAISILLRCSLIFLRNDLLDVEYLAQKIKLQLIFCLTDGKVTFLSWNSN